MAQEIDEYALHATVIERSRTDSSHHGSRQRKRPVPKQSISQPRPLPYLPRNTTTDVRSTVPSIQHAGLEQHKGPDKSTPLDERNEHSGMSKKYLQRQLDLEKKHREVLPTDPKLLKEHIRYQEDDERRREDVIRKLEADGEMLKKLARAEEDIVRLRKRLGEVPRMAVDGGTRYAEERASV